MNAPRDLSPGRARAVWALAVCSYLFVGTWICFWRLGATDVVTMEGIVADGARHMAAAHEVSVPRLYGEIYSYKPPLAYWLALASVAAFGEETAWTLRFPFALGGFVMGLAVLLLVGRVLGPGAGSWCALASITAVLTVQKIQLAEFDLPLAAGVGIAVAAACANLASERASAALWIAGYLALAFGFLAKGAPALMFYGPGLLAAALVTRRFRTLFGAAHLAGVLVFAALAGAWIASAFAASGWQAFAQPLAEAGDKLGWTWGTLASSLAKPGVVWALFLPWSAILPFGVRRRWWRHLERRTRLTVAAAGSFAVLGVAAFMLVPATESRYLLPLAVPMGIVCGVVVHTATSPRRHARRWAVALLAVALAHWLFHSLAVAPHRARSRSLRSVAEAFEAHLAPGATLWTGPVSKEFRHSSLTFYLRHPVKTFSPRGEMPEPGERLLLFSDEPLGLESAASLDYEILERRSQRGYEYVLAEVR